MITEGDVRKIFKGLEQGDGASFFEHVDDKVDWIVEGTHPLAGHYKSKSDFVAGTFAKLAEVLPNGAQLVVEHLIVKDDQAVVELHSLATAKNGLKFDNRYCWVCRFLNRTIVEVRAYLDLALVARLFAEDLISWAVLSGGAPLRRNQSDSSESKIGSRWSWTPDGGTVTWPESVAPSVAERRSRRGRRPRGRPGWRSGGSWAPAAAPARRTRAACWARSLSLPGPPGRRSRRSLPGPRGIAGRSRPRRPSRSRAPRCRWTCRVPEAPASDRRPSRSRRQD